MFRFLNLFLYESLSFRKAETSLVFNKETSNEGIDYIDDEKLTSLYEPIWRVATSGRHCDNHEQKGGSNTQTGFTV